MKLELKPICFHNCPQHPFFLKCSLEHNLIPKTKDNGKMNCAGDLASKLKKTNSKAYEIIEKDFKHLGWQFFRVEETFLDIEGDGKLHIRDGYSKQSTHLQKIFPNVRFLPLALDTDDFIKEKHYQLRGSEFHSKCPLQYVTTMIDFEKLGINIDIDLATSGIHRHAIAMDDCMHGLYLKDDRFKVPTSKWTEKNVEYVLPKKEIINLIDDIEEKDKIIGRLHLDEIPDKIVLRGSADCIAEIENNPDTLVVLDFKRYNHGEYEHIGSKFQFLSYALALNQHLDNKYDRFVLISQHRPLKDQKYAMQKPKYHITLVNKGDNFHKDLHREMIRRYFVKKKILDNKFSSLRKILDYQHTLKPSELNRCETLFSGLACLLLTNNYCGQITDKFFQNDIRQYLINGVKI